MERVQIMKKRGIVLRVAVKFQVEQSFSTF